MCQICIVEYFFIYSRTDQRPVYEIDFANSKYTSHSYTNNEHVFTVEQGTRFYLKLHLTANPMPTSATIYKNGQELPSSPWGTIYLCVNSVRIDSVTQGHAGRYRISSRNVMGEGSISFKLNVQGISINDSKFDKF